MVNDRWYFIWNGQLKLKLRLIIWRGYVNGQHFKTLGWKRLRTIRRLDKIANKVEAMHEYAQVKWCWLASEDPRISWTVQGGESLDDLLPEAFATAREGAKRVLGLYPFHVQIPVESFCIKVTLLKWRLVKEDLNGHHASLFECHLW